MLVNLMKMNKKKGIVSFVSVYATHLNDRYIVVLYRKPAAGGSSKKAMPGGGSGGGAGMWKFYSEDSPGIKV